jgi:hypothetical protein
MICCFVFLTTGVSRSSETPVDIQSTIWRYILEERTVHNHRGDNLKSYVKFPPLFYINEVQNHFLEIWRILEYLCCSPTPLYIGL